MSDGTVGQPRGLFVNHVGCRCGVFQFGDRLLAALAQAPSIAWRGVECDGSDDFWAACDGAAPDLVLFNHHPATLAWANALDCTGRGFARFAVLHETHDAAVRALTPGPFDFYLCADPTLRSANPLALAVPRFIAATRAPAPPPDLFTVGSFGFATAGKGFDRLCAMVCAQLDEARIRINIPPHDDEAIVPPSRVDEIIASCRDSITKPRVSLEITQDFMDEAVLLDFLQDNTINVFLYDDMPGRGVSSCTDYAIASGRPLAVSRSSMFRHLHSLNPSVVADDHPLAVIAAQGTAPFRHLARDWSAAAAGAAWNDAMLTALRRRELARSVPDGRGFNKILDDRARAAYQAAVAELHHHVPEMMGRKIERANVQQAFALDAAERLLACYREPRILAVGSFEDTAVATLKAKGWRIEEVDPAVTGLTLADFYVLPTTQPGSYDLVLCISVLEHVEDDVVFVRMLADLLAPAGLALMTVDFASGYAEHGRKPRADFRLYTPGDLRARLMPAIPGTQPFDFPNWDDGEEDFEYEGCRYAFATWTFIKLPPFHGALTLHDDEAARHVPRQVMLPRALDAERRLSAEVAGLRLELEQAFAGHQALQQELTALRSAQEHALARVHEVAALHAAAETRAAMLRGALAEAEGCEARLLQEHQQLQRAYHLVQHDRALLQHSNVKTRRQLRETKRSASWRLTRPLRSLFGLFRTLKLSSASERPRSS